MRPRKTSCVTRAASAGRLGRFVVLACACLAVLSVPVLAQGFPWPWGNDEPERPPVPPEPVYRPPAEGAPGAVAQPGPGGAWGGRNSICLQLEQRLVQEGQRGSQSRELIPLIESEIRQVEQSYRQAQARLDRADCFDFFLFSKTLRRTRKCVELDTQVQNDRRRLADLNIQRQQMTASSGRSYQDDIVRELARNNCGPAYQQEARKRDFNPFSSLWQDEGAGGGGGGFGTYNALPFATYRTLCVRLCDGYYFPISFSTLPNHFQRDAEACQSKCAAPAELYYHQNPGGAVDQMVGLQSNTPYTELKSAFRYRKEYVNGCSCKQAEYVPEAPPRQGSGDVAPQPGTDGARRAQAPAEGSDGATWQAETRPR